MQRRHHGSRGAVLALPLLRDVDRIRRLATTTRGAAVALLAEDTARAGKDIVRATVTGARDESTTKTAVDTDPRRGVARMNILLPVGTRSLTVATILPNPTPTAAARRHTTGQPHTTVRRHMTARRHVTILREASLIERGDTVRVNMNAPTSRPAFGTLCPA